MKNFSVITILLIVISITIGCSSKKNDPTANPPTNLVINATVAQDSSGNVSFTATAVTATLGWSSGTFSITLNTNAVLEIGIGIAVVGSNPRGLPNMC